MHSSLIELLDRVGHGERQAIADLAAFDDLAALCELARDRRDDRYGPLVSYSRKVFIPLTKLCRDVCHYCTFAHPPRKDEKAYLTVDEAVEIARAGQVAGCKEALFTLGDKPELRYRVAAAELQEMGFETTIAYLAHVARAVYERTGLLAHVNPGILTAEDLALLREASVSQGIMLETASKRLSQRGMPHFGSPDKDPAKRLETLRLAGRLQVPFTTGILIGIGETRRERIESLLEIGALHARYGHIQEVIVQNFRPKPGTRMQQVAAISSREHLWSVAVARLVLDGSISIQAPPNLNSGHLQALVDAGINDWGGVSPVTPDHVNPEAPWPHLSALRASTRAGGKTLVERLAIYPDFAKNLARWTAPTFHQAIRDLCGADGRPRCEDWRAGETISPPGDLLSRMFDRSAPAPQVGARSTYGTSIDRAQKGAELGEREIAALFCARGSDFDALCRAADELRLARIGNEVTYVVNRNINYTNICYFKCRFCAFSKGKTHEILRGKPYDLSLEEIARRVDEAWHRGATEVCMQGGIHPRYSGQTYLEICRAAKAAQPRIHIHAFSPLEVSQGASTAGLSVSEFLIALKEAGLGTLPGTAAEILDDDVRAILCPDKLGTRQWLEVMRAAHRLDIRTTATMMFGHVDGYHHWARHLLAIRRLQAETGGFTEFVPLPFVHREAPIYLKGKARPGPTFRETVLVHAVARLVLNPLVENLQVSWVKLGPEGAKACLNAGANDLGGTLMNETISRSAGASHGQEMSPAMMEGLIAACGRNPRQRLTDYGPASADRHRASFQAMPLAPLALGSPHNPSALANRRLVSPRASADGRVRGV